MSSNYKTIGIWTRHLWRPNDPPPYAYGRLKELFSKFGAILASEERSAKRTPTETSETDSSKRTLSKWTLEGEQILLREDGLLLISDLTEPVATLLQSVTKELMDTKQAQTFSIGPLPSTWDEETLVMEPIKKTIAPLNHGPFANARFWTSVDHIHDGANTKERYLDKQGIKVEPTGDKKKEAKA